MSPSVVVLQSPNSLYADAAGFTRVTPPGRGRARRQLLSTTLTLLSLSAWSYALVVGACALG